ncbi:ATP synthase protein I [Synechococcus sp. BIOS-E4-1]|nr:ATP synthase protein I [Synechococcus sp. BIOS-E4-1]
MLANDPTESSAASVAIDSGMADYARLQQRLMLATLAVSLVAVLVALVGFDAMVARSLLVGSCAGVLYLRLLARSVARLGGGSRQVGRFQLVVPVLLVVAAAKFPQLEILPAFIGFLLYKPALILQTVIDG